MAGAKVGAKVGAMAGATVGATVGGVVGAAVDVAVGAAIGAGVPGRCAAPASAAAFGASGLIGVAWCGAGRICCWRACSAAGQRMPWAWAEAARMSSSCASAAVRPVTSIAAAGAVPRSGRGGSTLGAWRVGGCVPCADGAGMATFCDAERGEGCGVGCGVGCGAGWF